MILPYHVPPVLTAYHNTAFPTGAVRGFYTNPHFDADVWIALKCAMCTFNVNSQNNKFGIHYPDAWGVDEGFCEYHRASLDKDATSAAGALDTIKSELEKGGYIYGIFNERYIPGKAAFTKYDFDHDYLIFGYDNGVYYSAGYLDNDRLNTYTISPEELKNALINANRSAIEFDVYRFDANTLPYCDFDRFMSDLSDYANSSAGRRYSDGCLFGFEAIEKLKEYLTDEAYRYGKIDKRYTKSLEEHKKALCVAIDGAIAHGTISNRGRSDLCTVLDDATLVHYMGLKLTLTGKSDIAKKIEMRIEKMLETEKRYFEKIL